MNFEKIIYRNSLIVVVFFLHINSFANVTREYNQQWFQYYNQFKLTNNIALLSDAGFRYKDEFRHKSQYLIRTALRYKINEKFSASIGLAHLGQYKNESINTYEIRPYQEILFKDIYRNIEINCRIRGEEQFFYDSRFKSNKNNLRARWLISSSIPLIKFANDMALNLSIGNEVFCNAKQNEIFNQNRVLVGPIIKINSNLNVSLIYNCQLSPIVGTDDFQEGQIVWVSIKNNVQLKNKN